MRTDPAEFELAKAYWSARSFEGLTQAQRRQITDRSRHLYRWFRAHQYIHYTISFGVIALLLSADFLVLLVIPRFAFAAWSENNFTAVLLNALIVGALRGWVMYSLSAYSLHEGAAHQLIFPPRGPITRILNAFANNLCRLTGADPVYYAHSHAPHHAKFGTEMDGEFSNFVRSRRYLATLIPFAMFINFSDFIVHRPLYYTRSRALSEFTVVCYNLCLFCIMSGLFGLLFTSTTILVVFPYVALQLDRLRQFSEHNLMPLDSKHGARSFGPGFWGLLIGGGPWGQPCHWIHHLVPNIPWYQQILLHLHVAPILSKQQHKQWMLDPVIGYPRLLWHLLRKPDIVAR